MAISKNHLWKHQIVYKIVICVEKKNWQKSSSQITYWLLIVFGGREEGPGARTEQTIRCSPNGLKIRVASTKFVTRDSVYNGYNHIGDDPVWLHGTKNLSWLTVFATSIECFPPKGSRPKWLRVLV